MSTIRNILFDLGNVIIDLDIPRTESALKKLLGAAADEVLGYFESRDLFAQYEIGKIKEETFLWAFQHAAKKSLDPLDLIKAWNAMLLGIPQQRLEMLEKLKEQYRLYLFSNTNETHLRWVRLYLRRNFNMYDFDERYFQKSYYSHLIGMRKPDVSAFEFILKDAGISGAETLFIDDMAENVAGAKKVGMKTIHLLNSADLENILRIETLLK